MCVQSTQHGDWHTVGAQHLLSLLLLSYDHYYYYLHCHGDHPLAPPRTVIAIFPPPTSAPGAREPSAFFSLSQ